MTRDDIIRMAREAGFERIVGVYKDGTRMVEVPQPELLERFATLVAAAEREAVIAAAIDQGFVGQAYADDFSRAMRARSNT